MGERWVNAVIEITIPLDVAVDASSHEKFDASVEAMDRVPMPDSATATCRWQVVEDGELVADWRTPAPPPYHSRVIRCRLAASFA
jgi:hypothetical protein